MAKHQQYKYTDTNKEVNLEFSFPATAEGDRLKVPFLKLLQEAANELAAEISKPKP